MRIDCPEKEGGIVPFQVNDWMYDIKFCVGLSENLQRCNEMAGFSTSKRSSLFVVSYAHVPQIPAALSNSTTALA